MTSERSTPETETEPTPEGRDGRVFVILSLTFLGLFLAFLLLVSPRLQTRLGLNGAVPFPTPPETVVVTLEGVPGVEATAIWDGGGVCAEVTDSAGTTFRTCAVPDPLRPIWAIDAPDDAAEPFLLVATPPTIVNLEGTTTDGETLAALTQARELPAAWALIPLPPGAALEQLTAFNAASSDVGGAQCTSDEAPTDGPVRLSGGCVVPEED